MGQKKNNELELMIRKIAKFNGKVLPVGEIDIVHDKDEMIKEKKETEEDESKTVEEMESDKTTIVNIIFRTKGELKKIFFISIIWFSLAMTYFGVSLGKNQKYLNINRESGLIYLFFKLYIKG